MRQRYSLEVITHGQPLNLRADNVDVAVSLASGEKFFATFFTLDNLRALFLKNRVTGECRNGTYLWAANMILVESLDEHTIREAIDDLIETKEFEKAFDGPHMG